MRRLFLWGLFFPLPSLLRILVFLNPGVLGSLHASIFQPKRFHYDTVEARYGLFSEDLRKQMMEESKKMFYFGYDNYMRHAFPLDELNPIYCRGRGPDYEDASNININDVLGDYSLSLVETLGTLAIMGNVSEFQKAVQLVVENVDFDKPNTVQVFEANIRVLGALLSAHLLIEDTEKPFGNLKPRWYEGQLLELAHNLGTRLLPAFEGSPTGIPLPRVNLRHGVPKDGVTETCPAGAGSLLLEFGILSRLLGDPTYEGYARRANDALWKLRSKITGLLGNVIDSQTGKWTGRLSGLGAGLDSFFEYLLKSYIMFGEEEDYKRFNESYAAIKQFLRRGRPKCNEGVGDHPLYVNVEMNTGITHAPWIDSLQVSFPAVQVLIGDIEEAICAHALYYFIWKRFGVFPERFNWQRTTAEVNFYPLRPELVEATYFLYQATRNNFYLHVGREILLSLNNYTKAECGYATVHDVLDMSLEDRMESFFLSETCKYLYLLFDTDNHINKHFSKYLFSTEGHIFPVSTTFRTRPWEKENISMNTDYFEEETVINNSERCCQSFEEERQYLLPLKTQYFDQVIDALGITN